MPHLPTAYIAIILVVVTFTLVALWLTDKSKRYLLWWAAAHFSLSLLILVFIPLAQTSLPHIFAYNLCHSLTSVAFISAAIQYRKSSFRQAYFLYAVLILTIFSIIVELILDRTAAQFVAGLGMSTAFMYTAWALWSDGLLARITAIFFGLRAVNALSFTVIAFYSKLLIDANVVSFMLVMMTLVSAMLLVLNVVYRSQIELGNHIKFLSLTQAISRELQGVSDQRHASERIIKLLLTRNIWTNAAIFTPSSDRKILHLLAFDGVDYTPELRSLLLEGLPVNDTFLGQAFLSKQPLSSYDSFGAKNIAKYGSRVAAVHKNTAQAAVPLVHDNEVFGVLIVNRVTNGPLLEEESKILENIGQVMGFAFANIKQLDELSYNATHDALTGLRNRVALHTYLEQQAAGKRFVLMLFDLNHFKEVNDTLGHSVGDSMLCALAKRLQNELENDAINVFRLGGDEFIVTYDISPSCPSKEQLAQQLIALISAVIHVDDLALRSSAAIGVVDSHGKVIDSHELLRCADLAMYQAKSLGAPIAYYEKNSDYDVQRRANILAGIAAAIDKGQLVLAYQPIINLQQPGCNKCEALIRWHHPEQGIIEAASFMPIIETTQMILKIARIVIHQAIKDTKAWRQAGKDMTVAINLSARNLMDEELVGFLVEQTQRYSLDPSYIQLEITETMLMTDRYAAEKVLTELVDAGFSIALDDFGTGYSSLAYLPSFPIHTLKIDGSFTRKMLTDQGTKSVVESTVELSHKLGFSVVAEGVENSAEAEMFKRMNCQYAQGYLYAKPKPQAEFSLWLANYNA